MRHARTMIAILIVLAGGVDVFTRPAQGGEPTDGRLGQRTVPIFLLTRPDVQADLKLTAEQVAECHRAARAFQLKASQLLGRKDPAVVAARREIDEAMAEWLTQHLSAQQLGRFEQVDLQWEGAAAMLSRPFLDESLNLTPDQKKKVRDYLDQSKLERARGAWSYEDHTNLTRRAIAELNDSQRVLWVRLLGPECHFSITGMAKSAQGQPAVSATSRPETARR